jgi:glucose-6-phosphate dehydrogenase assembly protein OpcA
VEEPVTAQSKLERFSAGEHFAVNPDAIERELASLWRAAGASTESRNPVTRACLWNVIVHIEERAKLEGTGAREVMSKAVRELPQYLAARALVLKTMPEEAGSTELESWISANCIVAEGGGKLVCSEEVVLAARGEGERHLPALVRALLVPAVPTAMVFAGVPPTERQAIEALVGSADRVVTHADQSSHAAPLKRIASVMSELPLGAIDLGWLSLSSYRTLVASLFDPPSTAEDVAAIDRVTITAAGSLRWSVLLMLAWIASALGAENAKPIGHGAWRFSRAGGRPLEVLHAEVAGASLPVIELFASSSKAQYAVRPVQDNLAEVTGPHIEAKKMLSRRTPSQLLARALRTRSEDRSFARALKLAGAMS